MEAIPRDYGEQCRFDAFCKTVLRNEARNYHRDMKRQRDHETSLSVLPQAELDKLYTVDHYPSDDFVFRRMAMIYISTTSLWPPHLPNCPSRRRAF